MEDNIVRNSSDIFISMVENEDEMEQDMARHTDDMGLCRSSYNGRSLLCFLSTSSQKRMVSKRNATRSQLSFNNLDRSRASRLPSI